MAGEGRRRGLAAGRLIRAGGRRDAAYRRGKRTKCDLSEAHLENVVLLDLLAWRDSRTERAELLYWRTSAGEEVDLVVETGGRVLPIEIKATSRPRLKDAANLRAFRAEYGKAARSGLLLHTGSAVEWLAPDVLAAPWWRVC